MAMDGWIRAVVEGIHSTPTQTVLYVAGGASQSLGWLVSVPGASNTVLEAVVPYSRLSMSDLLGKVPVQFTSRQTAEDLALSAYNRAMKLSRPGVPILGLGFTGSLASTYPKRGDHRFYLSTRTSDQLWTTNLTFSKGLRTREEEDKVSSQFVLKAIADACKLSVNCMSELSDSEVPDECQETFDEDLELQQLIDGKISMKIYPFGADNDLSKSDRKVILPGSFNPLHDGHVKLLDIASSMVRDGCPCFEMSAVNADKPPLAVSQIKERVRQFEKIGRTVIVTNQPYFYKKAELFPGSAFVIGADTAVRLINPKYYDNNPQKMIVILDGCKKLGCTFLVGARTIDGVLKVTEDLDIPEVLKDMFISIPEESFRMDISSTELRKKGKSVGL